MLSLKYRNLMFLKIEGEFLWLQKKIEYFFVKLTKLMENSQMESNISMQSVKICLDLKNIL